MYYLTLFNTGQAHFIDRYIILLFVYCRCVHFASIQFSIILNAKKGKNCPFLFKLRVQALTSIKCIRMRGIAYKNGAEIRGDSRNEERGVRVRSAHAKSN